MMICIFAGRENKLINMRNMILRMIALICLAGFACTTHGKQKTEYFPDGTPIPQWFYETKAPNINRLGSKYVVTDFGVTANDSNLIQTEQLQQVIDLAAREGGGVIVIPKGTFLSGSLFFKPKTHLYLEKEAVLKGSDDISNFPVVMTRIEGQTLKYFAALVNANEVNGFTISGEGTINGNGERYWKSFWLRRSVIPKCTNMDELRPRLLYVSNSNDVTISGVRLINSPFWTTHFYRCNNLKLLNLYIYSPHEPIKAPSTDAIDLDVCSNVLIKGCYMAVNDDAIALKGGKGPWADQDENNGGNKNIIIEDCTYGFCHSALTCGSESIHNRNIILRRCTIDGANRLLWLKMRPDTPQHYEYITVEDITGSANNFLFIKPWSQFFDLKGREDKPLSRSNNITMKNINLKCTTFFNVKSSEDYTLQDFLFENITVEAEKGEYDPSIIKNFTIKNLTVK